MAEAGEKKSRSGAARVARRANGAERTPRGVGGTGRHEAVVGELRQQLDDAERAKRELLSVVSHDLRNPLSVILVSAKLLARAVPPDVPARKQLDSIGRAAEEINHLIQD